MYFLLRFITAVSHTSTSSVLTMKPSIHFISLALFLQHTNHKLLNARYLTYKGVAQKKQYIDRHVPCIYQLLAGNVVMVVVVVVEPGEQKTRLAHQEVRVLSDASSIPRLRQWTIALSALSMSRRHTSTCGRFNAHLGYTPPGLGSSGGQ